jgi:hypothetical protein
MKLGRKRYAISKGGKYRYALAKLHKTVVDAQRGAAMREELRAQFALCGDWECTKSILSDYRIDVDPTLADFFENTTVKTKRERK